MGPNGGFVATQAGQRMSLKGRVRPAGHHAPKLQVQLGEGGLKSSHAADALVIDEYLRH